MEILLIVLLSGVFYFIDSIPAWLPIALYGAFWIIWLLFTGVVGIWRARLKKKYKGWALKEDDSKV
jgi:hypothetical protein